MSTPSEILKPLLAGEDVRAYEITYRDQHLIFTRRGTDLSRYPAIERHLSTYRADLTPKRSSADKRGRKPGSHEWFEIQDNVAYHARFDQPKILYPDIGLETRFVMDEGGHYAQNTAYFIASHDWFLLGVLNSATTFDFLRETTNDLRGGYLRFFGDSMERVPIPTASDADRTAVADLARRAQTLHGTRRARVEAFLADLGTSPAASSIRSPLETPWAHDLDALRKKAKALPGLTDRLLTDARDETAALTAQIAAVESDIDARVAALYGL